MGLLQKCVFQQKQKIRTGSCRLIRTLGVGVVWVRTEIRFRNVGALITRTGFGVYYGYNKEPPKKPILILKASVLSPDSNPLKEPLKGALF